MRHADTRHRVAPSMLLFAPTTIQIDDMTTPTIRGLRWWMIGLVMLGAIINYLTRSTLAVAAPTLMTDLRITAQEYSWIVGTFQIAIMLQPICGYVLDVLGLKRGPGHLRHGLVVHQHGARPRAQLADVRRAARAAGVCRGLGQPGRHEGHRRVVSRARARTRRRRLQHRRLGRLDAGAAAGRLGDPHLQLADGVCHHGQPGPGVGGLWLWLYESPETPSAPVGGRARASSPPVRSRTCSGDGRRPSIGHIARQRNFWGIALPRLLADPTWGTLTFWVPLYLTTVRHFDLKQIALFAWMPFLAADLGCLFGGALVMALQKRGVSLINARRWAFTVGACLMMGMGFVGVVDSPYAAIALLSLGGFAHQTLSVTVITMSSDLFKRNEVATAAGMAGTCGNAGLLVFSLLIGGLVTTVGYTPFFIGLAVLDLAGAALLWILVRDPQAEAVA